MHVFTGAHIGAHWESNSESLEIIGVDKGGSTPPGSTFLDPPKSPGNARRFWSFSSLTNVFRAFQRYRVFHCFQRFTFRSNNIVGAKLGTISCLYRVLKK